MSDETTVTVTISADLLAVAREIAKMAGADKDKLTDRKAIELLIQAKVQEMVESVAHVLKPPAKGVH